MQIGLTVSWKVCIIYFHEGGLSQVPFLPAILILLVLWQSYTRLRDGRINFFTKNVHRLSFFDIYVKLAPFSDNRKKKCVFNKIMSPFKRKVLVLFCKVWSTRHWINIEEIFRKSFVKNPMENNRGSMASYFFESL